MNTDHFYSNLKPTLNFKDILNQKNYSEVPDDWSVIITDVKGSTKAIESGRYKDVNTIGAASIVAVDKSLKDLEGLSCRWNPIKSQRGKILSLLVEAKGEKKDQIYTNVLLKLEEIFEGQLESANPVNFEETKYKTLWQIFQDEKRYQDTIFSKSFIKRLFEIILAVLLFKFHLKLPNFDSKGYIDSMVTHSDYRKFDDMLRMVIDCTH
jgi:hypothetical protein